MFKYILSTTSGDINWLAMLALITFFTIFMTVIFQLFFQKKEHNEYMSDLPLK